MTTAAYRLEDLGVAAYGDSGWMNSRHARHPETGAELALGSLSRGGFMVIDPARQWARQVCPERPFECGWAVGQAPNGDIYQCDHSDSGPLVGWDWKGERARVLCEAPALAHVFTLDVAPDGRVYLPAYTSNTLQRFDPATGRLENLGDFNALTQHIRNVFCAADGWVYVNGYSYDAVKGNATVVIAFDPRTNERRAIAAGAGLTRDAADHVLVSSQRWGRTIWDELVGGQTRPIAPRDVALTADDLPFAFRDGSHIKAIDETTVTFVDAGGHESQFTVEREKSPLRIFSVEAGGGKIWGGTFIPLTLFSFDPATGEKTGYGNPTKTNGEIYNLAFSKGKLYMASYTGATLTRYDPARPWRKDDSIHANPAHLGLIKETGLSLQRPHGRTMDPEGNVYFAAHGGYGCYDSGICRIEPDTDRVTSWLYPNTTFGALVYAKTARQLLVSERRADEAGERFTFISPADGRVLWSEIVIRDQGDIVSWLDGGDEIVFGLHAYRATLFAFSLSRKVIVAELREMRLGDHCCNALLDGPDGRIWGVTNRCVYAVARDLQRADVVVELGSHADKEFPIC
ncbi:MAG: hypothetical protein HYV36_07530 [Lentisphaerae bacterium]|nr:hypothetical protein [Lentisphaerota bacterium]